MSTEATRGKVDTGKGRTRAQGCRGKGERARADKGARAGVRVDMADNNGS